MIVSHFNKLMISLGCYNDFDLKLIDVLRM